MPDSQFGAVEKKERKKGPEVWVYRYYVRDADGAVKYASRRLGTVEQYRTKAQVERAAEAIRMEANAVQPGIVPVTMGGLIDRYVADKLPERYSTRSSYLSCLNGHIRPRWGEDTLQRVAAAPFEVEKWFEQLDLAPKTKGHLKAEMHRLFECAMKWALFSLGRNPMELVEIKGVTKRQKPPARVLTHDEFWKLVKFLREPYRTMVLVAQCLGLRISEVMALQWGDFDFANLTVRVGPAERRQNRNLWRSLRKLERRASFSKRQQTWVWMEHSVTLLRSRLRVTEQHGPPLCGRNSQRRQTNCTVHESQNGIR